MHDSSFCASVVASYDARGCRQLSQLPQCSCGYVSPKYASSSRRRQPLEYANALMRSSCLRAAGCSLAGFYAMNRSMRAMSPYAKNHAHSAGKPSRPARPVS